MDVAGLLTPLTVSETGSLREGSVQRLVVSAVRTCQFVQSQMALLSNGSTGNKFLGYLSKIGRLSGKKRQNACSKSANISPDIVTENVQRK